jgi:hypothetical protein
LTTLLWQEEVGSCPSQDTPAETLITEICLIGAVLVKNIEPRIAGVKVSKRQHNVIIDIFIVIALAGLLQPY